ncbi:hypothetical protein HHK36_010624 [Tetracentron sinense]|uniref:DYW domain-containing protein n=1 Tax=Tetracentron sinense TaxID=13715 RepID=A0A834Z7R9_TETSI|nr:hypothetical protein HHK36_010624 [Tetracentron sinense]
MLMLQRIYASRQNKGQIRKGLLLFHQLQKLGPGESITEFLLSAVLRSCGRIEEGKQAHCVTWKHGFLGDVILMTSLVNMYCKCTSIKEARLVYYEMPTRDVIATNCMIAGLCRCHFAMDAIQLFEEMPKRDVGSWNSLISGLAQNCESEKALFFFERMRLEGAKVDLITMVSVLSVCADLAALVNGKQVHGLVIKHGFELYLPIGNATVDMYAKSGYMDDACLCFDNMPCKNIVSWTSLIVGYGKHGLGLEAIKAFKQMEMAGIVPNKITFLGTLCACSHSGLVQEGWRNFNTMLHTYSITPMMEHYTCIVDLLARAGRLKEASEFIERMPIKPDAKLLTAFLSSCCSHRNAELTRSVGQRLLELEPEEAGTYILLSNFYGLAGDLEGVAKVRRLMSERGIRKVKACTWIEINRRVHAFESGDMSHPLSKEIYSYLADLFGKLKTNGYVPNTSMVVQNVDEHRKKDILLGHSEKLAIGLGLISTPPGTQIRIVKNLRVCVDCHVATQLISKIEGREIVARDSSRFHRFKDGSDSKIEEISAAAAGDDLDSDLLDEDARARRLTEDDKDKSLDVGPNGRPLFTSSTLISELTRKDACTYMNFSMEGLNVVLPEGLPMGMVKEFEESRRIALLVRQSFLDLRDNFRRIVDPPLWSSDGKGPKVRKQIVLDGPVSCGKSIALAMLVHWARDEGWLVFYVPKGREWTHGGFFYKNLQTDLWDTPVQAANILQDFLKFNEPRLQQLPCQIFDPIPLGEGAGVGWMKGVDSMGMPESSTLYDLIQTGLMYTHAAVGVVVRLRKELSLVKDIPVLIAIDQIHQPEEMSWPDSIWPRKVLNGSPEKMPKTGRDLEVAAAHSYDLEWQEKGMKDSGASLSGGKADHSWGRRSWDRRKGAAASVGKLRKDLPAVPEDARVNLPRYSLDEAAAVCHYYLRQRLIRREAFSEEKWKKIYYLSNGNGTEMRWLVPFIR